MPKPPSSRPTFFQAATVSVLTSLVFLVIYNGCNWITKLRPDVQQAAFGWEHWIPVIEWMIVPYWSLDVFFVLAPFLCSTRKELGTLKKRLVMANVIGGACFLIIPLELAWVRPEATGPFAGWFRAIQAMDAPHNLFPSLHIVLRTILAVHYARHTQGIWRALSHFWFSLIGVSTLLTWQHHVVDVAGGFLLAAVVFHVVPGVVAEHSSSGATRRLGWRYLAGAGLLLLACRLALPWSLIFSWPAAALGTVSAAYLGAGTAVLGKKAGKLSPITRWLLAPWLIGQEISWWWYRRQSSKWNKLHPRVWIGSHPDDAMAVELIEAGVTDVLDLTSEFDAPEPFRMLPGYRNIPITDLTAPDLETLQKLAAHLDRVIRDGIVYVHCKAGYSRTAAAVGAWLLQGGGTSEAAIRQMKEARPGMVIRPEVEQALKQLEQSLCAPGRSGH